MTLAFAICMGAGIAAAVGIRPFLPALAVAVLAAANAGIDFNGTKFAFLESIPFIVVLIVLTVVFIAAERRAGPERLESGALGATVTAIGPALGALLFAGALDDGFDVWWPGLIAGVLCALVAQTAIRSLLGRTRTRLDREAALALPVYAEAVGLVLAVAAVLLPPLGLIGFVFLVALLVTGRRRGEQKYAGLRVLR
jgi:hypothetical protein